MSESASDPSAMARVQALLGEDAMARARMPLEVASGLPKAACCSPEWRALLAQLPLGRISSPAYDGGRRSPYWDGATHAFSRRVIDGMVAA